MKPQCRGPWAPAAPEARRSELTLCAEGPQAGKGLACASLSFPICKMRTDSVAVHWQNPDRLHLGLQMHSGSSTHRVEARKEKGSEQQPGLRVEGACGSFSLPTRPPHLPPDRSTTFGPKTKEQNPPVAASWANTPPPPPL